MKNIMFFLFLLALLKADIASAQRTKDLNSCSQLLEDLSYYWKKDSLANNGLRLYTYDKFLKCSMDSITVAQLLQHLGKPNETKKVFWGTQYIYYTWDIRRMPKDFDGPMACTYIAFSFKKESAFLYTVTEGDTDIWLK